MFNENEQYLRGILESTNNGIIAVDRNRKIIGYNRRFAELWNIPEDLLSEGDVNVVHNMVYDQFKDPYAANKIAFLSESENASFDTVELKNGTVLERFSIPLMVNNELAGRVWSIREVTDHKTDVPAIEQKTTPNKAAWVQWHLVREPLVRILGLTDLLINCPYSEEEHKELLEYLDISAKELDKVIKSILK